jgi:hypothetical protein
MNVLPFISLFPEVARHETRSVTLTAGSVVRGDVRPPPDDYGFLEHYCADPACDCRRVILAVMSRSQARQVGTISHSFEPPGRGALIKEQTFLDPLGPQSPFSPGLLAVFQDIVLDAEYAARLVRHYRMVKKRFGGATAGGGTGQNRAARRAPKRGGLKPQW